MHSSRMRTARLLAVSPSMYCAGGVGVFSGGGGVCSRGVCSGVMCLLLGVSVPGGVCYPSMH